MSLVNYEAMVLELRGRLLERPSWGSSQIRSLIDELEQKHRQHTALPPGFNDQWLAGFADGEGCFLIGRRNHAGVVRYAPAFMLGLRADDALVIARLQRSFGGSISVRRPKRSTKPAAYWTVSAVDELVALSRYFSVFPLRAKKARECLIWQEAIEVYRVEGSRSPTLAALYDDLRAQREYRSPLDGLEEPDQPATPDPLPAGDRETPATMDDGADLPSQPREALTTCPPHSSPQTASPPTRDFRRASAPPARSSALSASS